MKIRALIIEIGIRNIDKIKEYLRPKNVHIIYASSFLDVVDTIHLEDVHIIVLSDFRGIKSTVGYIKMFTTTNPNFKIILLSNNKSTEEETKSYYIQRGAYCLTSCYDLDRIEKDIACIYRKIIKDSDIPDEWTNCTKKAIRFIKDNYHIKNNLIEELTKEINYSPSSIYHSVKNDTGKSLGTWIQELRIKGSIELLKSTDYPIKYISEKIGYRSIQGFLKAFKKNTGNTPSVYRNI